MCLSEHTAQLVDCPLPVCLLFSIFFCVPLCFICSPALVYLSLSFSPSFLAAGLFCSVSCVSHLFPGPASSVYFTCACCLYPCVGLVCTHPLLFCCQPFLLPVFCYLHSKVLTFCMPNLKAKLQHTNPLSVTICLM